MVNPGAIQVYPYQSPVGELILGSFEEDLVLCDWRYRRMRAQIDKRIKEGLKTDYAEGKTRVIEETMAQLDSYFQGKLQKFTIPYRMVGTPFQIRVWSELDRIPYGETRSYLELSERLGDTLAIRAVASANGANALSILLPCHRVVGSKGELTGYAGGLGAKKKLLELEGVWPVDQQLRMFNDPIVKDV